MSDRVLPVATSAEGIEKVSENGWLLAVGAPDRPRPPGAVAFDLDVLIDEGPLAQRDAAGCAIDWAGAAEEPSEGKASTESTAGAEELESPLLPLLAPLLLGPLDLGVGALPRVGNGSGAPSSPCLCIVSLEPGVDGWVVRAHFLEFCR